MIRQVRVVKNPNIYVLLELHFWNQSKTQFDNHHEENMSPIAMKVKRTARCKLSNNWVKRKLSAIMQTAVAFLDCVKQRCKNIEVAQAFHS